MDDECIDLYMHAFDPDICLLPDGSLNFGRAIKTRRVDLASHVPLLKDRIKEAIEIHKDRDEVDCPRTIAAGVHPGSTCADTIQSPIEGMLYRAASNDLCQASYDALDEGERGKYEAIAPTAFFACDPTDDDDGLLCLTLPGTRRAIELLVKKCQQLRFEDRESFWEMEEAPGNKMIEDNDVLCEYLELACAVEMSDRHLWSDLEPALDGAPLRPTMIARARALRR